MQQFACRPQRRPGRGGGIGNFPCWHFHLIAFPFLLLMLPAGPAMAQEGTVAGTIVAEQSLRPLPGAQVVVEGTGRGTLTNARGEFLLTGLAGPEVTLRVILIGYRSVDRSVEVGETDVQIRLDQTAVALEEIVVTGVPGATQAKAIGNAVASVDLAASLQAQPVRGLQGLLKGKVPGMTVQTSQGNVGTGGLIRIRGAASLTLGNQPLIYIDGVRINNDPRAGPSIRGGAQMSRLNDLNPANIESIEVIKGPAAATLYGTEASNGVIQIFTKQGRQGAPRLEFTVKQGGTFFRDPAGRLPTNYARDPVTGELLSLDLYEVEKAAGREMFQTGHTQSYDASVSGGSDQLRYFAALGWDDTEGIVDYNWQEKMSARANLKFVPSATFTTDLNFGLITSETRFGQAASGFDLMSQINWGSPLSRDTRLRGFLRATPEAAATIESYAEVTRATGGVQFQHDPIDWLSHRLTAGVDITNAENSVLFPRHPTGAEYFFGASSLGDKQAERNFVFFTTVDYAATADFTMTESLRSATSVGAQYFSRRTEALAAEGLRFPAPPVKTIGGAALTFGDETFIQNKTFGVFIQEQISWNDRIFLTGAVRGDDNSAFGQNFDFVVYPKVSATWVLSEEEFFPSDWVNAFKLRGAWGTAGQQPNVFAAIRLYSPVTGPTNAPTLTPLTIGNPDLEPERGEELELGFDASFFEDRLGVVFTYYDQKRKNAIIEAPVAPSSGFPGSRFVNVGQVDTWGVELGLDALLLSREDFSWDIGVNVATNDSEIVDLGGFPALGAGALQLHREGFPVGAYFMRRVVSAEMDADGTVTSALCAGGPANNGQPVPCAEAPEVFAGVPHPTLTGSVSTSIRLFENLRLAGQVDFQSGHNVINGDVSGAHHVFRNTRAINTNASAILNAYDQLPGFSFFHSGLFPAGFAKLRNLSVTYTVPPGLLGGFGASSASLTVAGHNLAILWQETADLFGREIIDPENRLLSQHSGYVQTVLPHASSVVTTLRLTF